MTLIDVGKNWEGRVIDGKFPLLSGLVAPRTVWYFSPNGPEADHKKRPSS